MLLPHMTFKEFLYPIHCDQAEVFWCACWNGLVKLSLALLMVFRSLSFLQGRNA